MRMSNNSSSESNSTPAALVVGLNFFLPSPLQCQLYNVRTYCVYATFLILVSYFLFAASFILTFYRMNQLGERFRNQYNLSLLWVLSIFLFYSIDLLEYVLVGDPYIQSRLTIGLVCVCLCILILICLRYIDQSQHKDPQFYRNMIGIAFTIVLLLFIVIVRAWSESRRTALRLKNINVNDNGRQSYTGYLLMYQFVFLMFGSIQIYENIKSNIYRVFTNMAYVLWIGAALFQSSYLSILPQSPKYDYVFYRNYLMLTTVLYIVIQDIAGEISRIKIKLSQRHLNVSMIASEMKGDGIENYPNNRLRFVENAFQGKMPTTAISSANDEEEVFDRTAYKQMYLGGGQHPQPMMVVDECYVDTTTTIGGVGSDNGPMDPSVYRTRLRIFYISLVVLFAFMLIAVLSLVYRVQFSFFTLQVLLISPLTIFVSVLLKHFQLI